MSRDDRKSALADLKRRRGLQEESGRAMMLESEEEEELSDGAAERDKAMVNRDRKRAKRMEEIR